MLSVVVCISRLPYSKFPTCSTCLTHSTRPPISCPFTFHLTYYHFQSLHLPNPKAAPPLCCCMRYPPGYIQNPRKRSWQNVTAVPVSISAASQAVKTSIVHTPIPPIGLVNTNEHDAAVILTRATTTDLFSSSPPFAEKSIISTLGPLSVDRPTTLLCCDDR